MGFIKDMFSSPKPPPPSQRPHPRAGRSEANRAEPSPKPS